MTDTAAGDLQLTIEEIVRTNASRAVRWHPPETEQWSGADWSNAMCGEAGEAANVVKKIRRHETGLAGLGQPVPPLDELHSMLADELADVVCYLVLLANHYDVDLTEAIVSKFNRVSELQGFPERLPSLADQIEGQPDLSAPITRPVEQPHAPGCNLAWDHFGDCAKVAEMAATPKTWPRPHAEGCNLPGGHPRGTCTIEEPSNG